MMMIRPPDWAVTPVETLVVFVSLSWLWAMHNQEHDMMCVI